MYERWVDRELGLCVNSSLFNLKPPEYAGYLSHVSDEEATECPSIFSLQFMASIAAAAFAMTAF